MEVLAATPGKVVCEMRVEEEHTNRGGTLHGGLTATLVDVISTMAIMNSERGAPGVSVDMNITWVYTKLRVITHLISKISLTSPLDYRGNVKTFKLSSGHIYLLILFIVGFIT